MFLLVANVYAETAGTSMSIEKYCDVPLWISNTDLAANINVGSININFYPICCGVQYNPNLWSGGAFPGYTVYNLPRCDLCQIRIIEYFGNPTRESDTGWINLSQYYVYSLPEARDWYYEQNAMDLDWWQSVIGDNDVLSIAKWGMTLYNHSIDLNNDFMHRSYIEALNATYNHTFVLNVTGPATMKIMVKAGERIQKLYRRMYARDVQYYKWDPEPFHSVANATPNTLGYSGGYYTELINISVVASGGINAGEGSTTKGGTTFQAPDTFFTGFNNYDVVWWVLTVFAVGFILTLGGISSFKGKDNKLMLVMAGFVLLLMIFTGGYLGVISWTYFVVIGIIGIAFLALMIRGLLV